MPSYLSTSTTTWVQVTILASSPIISWQIDGEKMETVTDFIFLGSKITVVSDCSHEIKRYLLWKKNYHKPRQCIKKQRHYFKGKCPYSRNYDFSSSHVWTWKLDHKGGWAQKNCCFWTVVLETLESPLDCKDTKWVNSKGNQPLILEGSMLKLKLQYFGYLMQRTDSSEKILMLGNIEGRKRRGQKMSWLGGIIDSMQTSLSKLRERVRDREDWRAAVRGVAKSRTQLSDGTTDAIGEEQRNTSRRNEESGPKQKQCRVVDVSGIESKLQCYKQYCIDTGMLAPWIKVHWKWSNRRWQQWTLTFFKPVN